MVIIFPDHYQQIIFSREERIRPIKWPIASRSDCLSSHSALGCPPAGIALHHLQFTYYPVVGEDWTRQNALRSVILQSVHPSSDTSTSILVMWTSPLNQQGFCNMLTHIITKSVEILRSGETDGMKWPGYWRLKTPKHIRALPWKPSRCCRFLMATISWDVQQSVVHQRDGQMFRYDFSCGRKLWLLSDSS